MRLIDLSHTIYTGMPAFNPDWQPVIEPFMTHEQAAASGRYLDCSCEVTRVSLITSIGTYMDSPYHFHASRATIDRLSLDQTVLPAVVIDCTNASPREPLSPARLSNVDIRGKAVLLHTNWDRYWGQPEYFEYPFISRDLALALVDGGAKLAGMDFLAADDFRDPRRPAHVNLLGADVLIVENLTHLDDLPRDGFIFHAAPVKIQNAAAFPVRAYAVLP